MAISNKYDLNKTRYTHRDYDSIKSDLIEAIPALTQEWTSREESDPGIVLIKLMSMFGDSLSYNVDKIALELYIQTVTQRKNCSKILRLLGYKMHWYRSARVVAHTRLKKSTDEQGNPIHILLTPFETTYYASGIPYTVIRQSIGSWEIDISSSTESYPVKLVQGRPSVSQFGESDLVNNRYYLSTYNVDETEFNLRVVAGRPAQCRLVENLYLVSESNIICYEFDVDEYDRPYIKLADNWRDIASTSLGTGSVKFELSYVISDGRKGNISSNSFNLITSTSVGNFPLNNLVVTNIPNNTMYGEDGIELDSYNRPGYDPQTVEEAKKDSANYVFTHDTLVTSSDYEKAAKRVNDITVSKMVDGQVVINDMLDLETVLKRCNDNFGDPVEEEYVDPVTGETVYKEYMAPYQVILYLAYRNFDKQYNQYFVSPSAGEWSIYTPDGDPYDSDFNPKVVEAGFYPYKPLNNILLSVRNLIEELHTLNVRVGFGTMKLFPFKVKGTVHLIEPMSPSETLQIINDINDALNIAYYPDLHPIGEKPNFIELVDTIQNSNTRIKYFDAIGNIVEWAKAINVSDPSADNYIDKIFDTTSAIMYNGLSDEFTLAPKFLNFRLKNVGYTPSSDDVQEAGTVSGTEGSTNLPTDFSKAYLFNYTEELNKSLPEPLSKTFTIDTHQEKTLQLNNVAELIALCKDMNYKGYAEVITEEGGSPEVLYISNLGLQWFE